MSNELSREALELELKSTEELYYQNKIELNNAKQRIKKLEEALKTTMCSCRKVGMMVDGVHCERCKALGLPPGC